MTVSTATAPVIDAQAVSALQAGIRQWDMVLRQKLLTSAIQVDTENGDSTEGMPRSWSEGIPVLLGGLSSGGPALDAEQYCDTLADATAGDTKARMHHVAQTACDYARSPSRTSLSEFSRATKDPLPRRRMGEFAAEFDAAGHIELLARFVGQVIEEVVEALAVRVTWVKTVTAALFEVTGARSNSAKHRIDWFWADARALAPLMIRPGLRGFWVGTGTWRAPNHLSPHKFVPELERLLPWCDPPAQ